MTFYQILEFFVRYKYWAILPVAIAEGPIITIISGFLVSIGNLSLLPTFLIVFLGDLISDSIFYFMGRGGRHAIGYFKFTHIPEKQIQKLEDQFKSAPWRTMIVAKISYGLGSAFMAASGASRMSWKKFIQYIVSLDFVRSSILLSIGFYFGKAAVHIGRAYSKYYIVAVVILVPVGYLIYHKKFKKPSLSPQ